jgi:hypothetical protein
VTSKIRSGRSPLIKDYENELKLWSIEENWKIFKRLGFFGAGQRRGTHVSVPKIGSRVGKFCFGGILGIHAVSRRELIRGNLNLLFFEVLFEVLRGPIEEGDHLCAFLCI